MSKSKQKKVNPYKKPVKKKTPWALIIAAAVIVIALIAGGIALFGGEDESPVTNNTATTPAVDLLSGTHYVEIEIKDYGTIKAELYADIAPISVTNFVNLAKEGFYDGLTFHRIMSGFMIQGGDPMGNGMGGSTNKIKGEFSANGVKNDLKHTRGVLSMARTQAYNSATSQFFIMHADYPSLDGLYAAFGKVTEGIEIVDAICENTPVTDNNGSVTKENQPVITAIRVVEK